MFSFHKPRVYRSTEGCCICRAKSSSSRFTDSEKYEEDSVKCFNLIVPRKGEICNACVLLVKRFKRLPNGSTRHWAHVVDARSGPGTKSMTKINKKMKDEYNHQNPSNDHKNLKSSYSLLPEKFAKILKKTKKNNKKKGVSNTNNQNNHSINNQLNNKTSSIISVEASHRFNKRKPLNPKKNYIKVDKISFVDVINWKLLNICCGIGYENNSIDALIIDIEKFKPCAMHSKNLNNNHTDIMINTKLLHNSAITIKKYHLFSKKQPDSIQQLNNDNLININNNDRFMKAISNIKKTDLNNRCEFIKQLPSTSDTNKINGTKNSILHKIKDSTGKIVKKSITKFNTTAINLNCAQLNDIKHLIKPIQKSIDNTLVIKKTSQLKVNNITINPSATKFSDNSSDSGFDENLDRKSISPTEVQRLELVPGIPTKSIMYLTTNNKDVQRIQQNIILTKNENTVGLLKPRLK